MPIYFLHSPNIALYSCMNSLVETFMHIYMYTCTPTSLLLLQVWKSVRTGHHSNIFSAKFLPNSDDLKAVSCAGIGSVEYTELTPMGDYIGHPFKCQSSITYQVYSCPTITLHTIASTSLHTHTHTHTHRLLPLRMTAMNSSLVKRKAMSGCLISGSKVHASVMDVKMYVR